MPRFSRPPPRPSGCPAPAGRRRFGTGEEEVFVRRDDLDAPLQQGHRLVRPVVPRQQVGADLVQREEVFVRRDDLDAPLQQGHRSSVRLSRASRSAQICTARTALVRRDTSMPRFSRATARPSGCPAPAGRRRFGTGGQALVRRDDPRCPASAGPPPRPSVVPPAGRRRLVQRGQALSAGMTRCPLQQGHRLVRPVGTGKNFRPS